MWNTKTDFGAAVYVFKDEGEVYFTTIIYKIRDEMFDDVCEKLVWINIDKKKL